MSEATAAATLSLAGESAGIGRVCAPTFTDSLALSRGTRALRPIDCLGRIIHFILPHLNQLCELVLQRLFVGLGVSEALLNDVELPCGRELQLCNQIGLVRNGLLVCALHDQLYLHTRRELATQVNDTASALLEFRLQRLVSADDVRSSRVDDMDGCADDSIGGRNWRH